MENPIWGPSGGMTYHFRALLYSRGLWNTFQNEIELWLRSWDIPGDEILLIGPSAGYTLPYKWLKNIRRIYAIEPDPIARSIFEYRFGRTRWIRHEWFVPIRSGISYDFPVSAFFSLASKYNGMPILFCNVLGQLPVIYKEEIRKSEYNYSRWKKDMLEVLKQTKFASYHDLYSSQKDFAIRNNQPVWHVGAEVIDHQISDMFATIPDRKVFRWALTPRKIHAIEAVKN